MMAEVYTGNNARDNNGILSATPYYGNKIVGNIVLYAGNADAGTIYTEAGGIYGSQGYIVMVIPEILKSPITQLLTMVWEYFYMITKICMLKTIPFIIISRSN